MISFLKSGKIYKKVKAEKHCYFSASVPRPGIEPGWVAPLVFETSASTDSAIWAFASAKLDKFSISAKFLSKNRKNLSLRATFYNFQYV